MPRVRVPFRKTDMRFRKRRTDPEPNIRAVWIEIMDTSGSMTNDRLLITRAFNDYAVRWLKSRYPYVETVFIAHDAAAREESYENFKKRANSGGTNFSTGYNLALEIIRTRYSSGEYNIYVTHSTDGENVQTDDIPAMKVLEEIARVSQLVGYLEVKPTASSVAGQTYAKVVELAKRYPHVKAFLIRSKSEVRKALVEFLKENDE